MRPPPAIAAAAILAAVLAPPGAAGTALEFTVGTRQGPTSVHPHPPAGGLGDSYVSSLELVNRAGGQLGRAARSRVGTMQLTYTVTRQCASSRVTCVARAEFSTVSTLPGGTVSAGGSSIATSSPRITLPVTGGTGRFQGATGTVTISPGRTKTSTYELELP